MQFLLVQNKQQTHDLTLIGSGANGLGIHRVIECIQIITFYFQSSILLVSLGYT